MDAHAAVHLAYQRSGQRAAGRQSAAAGSPAARAGRRPDQYGVFDIYFDTRSPEQIVVGKLSSQQDQIFYDLWMSFPMRSLRKAPLSDSRFGGPSGPLWTPDVMSISKYTINAHFESAA